tara:strand:- start:9 stop:362 length:354 start_codon:yes stop_codon:yes gene_type:complete
MVPHVRCEESLEQYLCDKLGSEMCRRYFLAFVCRNILNAVWPEFLPPFCVSAAAAPLEMGADLDGISPGEISGSPIRFEGLGTVGINILAPLSLAQSSLLANPRIMPFEGYSLKSTE